RRRTGARARPRRGRRADPHRPGRLGRPAAQERLRACSPRARARAAPPAAADAGRGGGVAQAGLEPATDELSVRCSDRLSYWAVAPREGPDESTTHVRMTWHDATPHAPRALRLRRAVRSPRRHPPPRDAP